MLERRGRQASSLRRALIILPVWAASTIWMWSWWINNDKIEYLPLYVPLTLAMLYEFAVLPTVFLYFVLKAKSPSRRIAPKNKKVAVISLCVPSTESIDIVEKQLKAMTEITYPHDSWILDEGNSLEIKKLAKKYGVKHFSRRGIRKYNQLIPPFKKKTKAGNVNAWLDFVKRRKYEYFVQFDIDHVAKPNYLHKTLGHFRDEKVAWVQAPSVYKNRTHWTARGAAEEELVLQGPLQMGFYGHSKTPFIIGSHCTYRMSAIREIGGFQPTRAEDHLDTVVLANKGYTGVFIPEIIAEGDGPETLSIYLAQQFAWAYSMFQVLLWHSPALMKAMPWKRKWQFMFAQTWYPLWSLSYIVLFMSPMVALLLNKNIANVEATELLSRFVPVFFGAFLIWWAARPLMQPSDVRLSWRSIILHAVRWPIILRAIFSAAFKIKKPYMITPKGTFSKQVPSIKTYQPFLVLGFLCGFAALYSIFQHGETAPQAQMLFTLANAGFMLSICTIDISIRYKQAKPKLVEFKKAWLKPVMSTACLGIFITTMSFTSFLVQGNVTIFARNSVEIISTTQSQPVSYDMTTEELIKQIQLVEKQETISNGLGIYNSKNVSEPANRHIQHTFADWRDPHYVAYSIAKTLQAENTPLITIEPRGEDDGVLLLNNIINGNYDSQISEISKIVQASDNTIYIRFAHEMELSELYPWGNQDPVLFKSAYTYFINSIEKEDTDKVKWVWAPAGNFGSEIYYPGDEYVDIIGTTILYDQYWYGYYQPSFYELAYERSWLQQYNKPVWVVEFGVGKHDQDFQATLINQAIETYQAYGYDALLYINIEDSNIDGPDYTLPTHKMFGGLYDVVTVKNEAKEESLKPVEPIKQIYCAISLQDQFSLEFLFVNNLQTKRLCESRL